MKTPKLTILAVGLGLVVGCAQNGSVVPGGAPSDGPTVTIRDSSHKKITDDKQEEKIKALLAAMFPEVEAVAAVECDLAQAVCRGQNSKGESKAGRIDAQLTAKWRSIAADIYRVPASKFYALTCLTGENRACVAQMSKTVSVTEIPDGAIIVDGTAPKEDAPAS